jgi:hypothetical protein
MNKTAVLDEKYLYTIHIYIYMYTIHIYICDIYIWYIYIYMIYIYIYDTYIYVYDIYIYAYDIYIYIKNLTFFEQNPCERSKQMLVVLHRILQGSLYRQVKKCGREQNRRVTRGNYGKLLQKHLGQSTIFVPLLGKFPARRTSPHTSPQNCSCSSIANHSVTRTERFQHAACLPNSLFEAKLHKAKVNINCHQLMNHLSEASLMCMSSNVISTRHVDSTIQMAPILSFQGRSKVLGVAWCLPDGHLRHSLVGFPSHPKERSRTGLRRSLNIIIKRLLNILMTWNLLSFNFLRHFLHRTESLQDIVFERQAQSIHSRCARWWPKGPKVCSTTSKFQPVEIVSARPRRDPDASEVGIQKKTSRKSETRKNIFQIDQRNIYFTPK